METYWKCGKRLSKTAGSFAPSLEHEQSMLDYVMKLALSTMLAGNFLRISFFPDMNWTGCKEPERRRRQVYVLCAVGKGHTWMEKEEFGLVSKCSNQAVKFLPSQFLQIGILEDRKDVGRMLLSGGRLAHARAAF